MVVGEHAPHLVELAHDGLALEAAAACGVPGPEDLHGALQRRDLLGPHRGRFVTVEGRLARVGQLAGGAWGVGGGESCRIRLEPVVHCTGEC